jgi:hypothetical protein
LYKAVLRSIDNQEMHSDRKIPFLIADQGFKKGRICNTG